MQLRIKQIVVLMMVSFALVITSFDDLSAQVRAKRTEIDGAPPERVLWVGNSLMYYNDGMNNYVGGFIRASDTKIPYRGTLVGISGSGIDWHDMESYFRPNGLIKYNITDNELRFNKLDKLFDAVIISECSQCPVHAQLKAVFHEYAKKQSDIIRKHRATPIFLMTWGYKDKPEMTGQLAEAYTVAGNSNDALVVPAGLAFAKAMAKRPDVELHKPDKRHPSLAGTYLAAATVYAAIYKKAPVGSKYLGGLDADTAKSLQTIAWETTQEYFGR